MKIGDAVRVCQNPSCTVIFMVGKFIIYEYDKGKFWGGHVHWDGVDPFQRDHYNRTRELMCFDYKCNEKAPDKVRGFLALVL